jgi:hypothetical protein
VAWKPVVGYLLPRCGIGHELTEFRSDPRIAVEPRRTPVVERSSGSRVKIADPHSPQNHFSCPSAGRHALSASSPERMRNAPGATVALAKAAAPVRRWQRVQWQ